jgi:uncharacterized protein
VTGQKPQPIVTELNQPFLEAARQGSLLLQRCGSCGSVSPLPPRYACSSCGGYPLTWFESDGRGTVYSFALVRRPQHAAFEEELPIRLIAVELDDGPMLISALEAGDPIIGARVAVTFRAEELPLPRFRLIPEDSRRRY